jgi:hypothetical protein
MVGQLGLIINLLYRRMSMINFLKILLLTLTITLIVPMTAWANSAPHCTDGHCTEYVEDCWNKGNEVMCLNALSAYAVTVCINPSAAAKILEHHPEACRGVCDYPTVCNFDFVLESVE